MLGTTIGPKRYWPKKILAQKDIGPKRYWRSSLLDPSKSILRQKAVLELDTPKGSSATKL
jgi:hypothetical protein